VPKASGSRSSGTFGIRIRHANDLAQTPVTPVSWPKHTAIVTGHDVCITSVCREGISDHK